MKSLKKIFPLLLLILFSGGYSLPDHVLAEQLTEQQAHELSNIKEVIETLKHTRQLPAYYITKEEARQLGWDARLGNLNEVAPGKVIGGDRFLNKEGLLPDEPERIWYEADLYYQDGHRGEERIVFSNDGLIYLSDDHYQSFQQVYPISRPDLIVKLPASSPIH